MNVYSKYRITITNLRQGDKNLSEREMNSSSTRVQKRNNFKSK
jgi:hypothetical protein